MKKFLAALVAITPLAVAGSAVAADKTLTIASWAGPAHTMNANLFPQMISELEGCSGGSLSAKVEFGLSSPLALYDTVRDGVADISWIVYGYTPGKFTDADKINAKSAHLFGISWPVSGIPMFRKIANTQLSTRHCVHAGNQSRCAVSRSLVMLLIWVTSSSAAVCGSNMAA